MNAWNRVELISNDKLFIKITNIKPNTKTNKAVKEQAQTGDSRIKIHIDKSAKKRESKEVIDIIAMDGENTKLLNNNGFKVDAIER